MITVSKLDTPRYEGDWHDAPLRWSVEGPGAELQLFSTKKWADLYARIRRRSSNAAEAGNEFYRKAV